MNILRLSTLSLALAIAVFALAFANSSSAQGKTCAPDDTRPKCTGGGDDPSGGGKAFLFVSPNFTCADGAIDTTGASYGNISYGGNVLWDPNFIHVHFKLQLKDVDPTGIVRYEILGNNDIACNASIPNVDFRLCEDLVCDGTFITVKQNRQGRTSGAVRLPGDMPGETTRVWVRVDVSVGGEVVELRSTAVTIVLPPNAAGCGTTACPE